MDCTRCGHCCISAHIALYSIKVDDDQQEYGRWLSYHGLGTSSMDTDDGKVLVVKVPTLCQHLKFNGATGQTSCAIYDTRPQICKEHKCVRLRESEENPLDPEC